MALYQDPGFGSLAQRFGLRKSSPLGYVTPSAANGWAGRTSEDAGAGPGKYWDGNSWAENPTQGRREVIPANTPGIGYSYLNSNEGAGAAYSLFNNLADEGKKRAIGNAFGQVYTNYKAAAALKPTLQFTDFLAEVDPNAVYHGMNFFDRGERPSAYQGRYKYVSGG